MLKHYLKLAFRILNKDKGFSLINLLGLTLGFSMCILIAQYVTFQFSFDQFHANKDQLYRVTINYLNDKGIQENHAGISSGIGPFLRDNFAEIDNQARVVKSSAFNRTSMLKYENAENNQSSEFHEDEIYFVDSTFFEIFTYPIVNGDSESPLSRPNTMSLSESAANKYFGDESPIGKTLTFNQFHDFEITGVFRDPPLNSHQQFEFLLNLEGAFQKDLLFRNNLHLYGDQFHTYIQLGAGITGSKFRDKIQQPVLNLTDRKQEQTALELQPVPDIHLQSNLTGELNQNGSYLITNTLSVIALLILLLAWSNFTNLSLLRNSMRTKEAGVRKTLGALKHQLTIQFVLESLLINFLSFIVALALVETVHPFFSNLLGYQLPPLLYFSPMVFLGLCLAFVTGSLLSGLFPSLVVASASPASALKSLPKLQGNALRKGIVTFQMIAVFVLVTCTYTITRQMDFIKNKDLGLQVDQVLVMNGPKLFNDDDLERDRVESYQQFVSRYNTFKSELMKKSSVTSVSSSNYIPGDEVDYLASLENPDSSNDTQLLVKRIFVNYDFDEVYNLDMRAGRFYSDGYNDENNAIVLNETAIKQLGFTSSEDALNKEIYYWDNPVTIIGVANDFHFNSLKTELEPMFFWLTTERTFISAKLSTENIDQAISDVNETWQSVFQGSPFRFFFADEHFNIQYQEEQKLETLIAIFTLVAIIIASLGLFGLAAFMIQRRTKEIGIRKVLGATVSNIVALLSKDFIKLLLVGFLIAVPIAWYAMNQWLADFAYRIEIGPGIFALAGGAAVVITLLTVSLQSIKAAVANPVESLKSE